MIQFFCMAFPAFITLGILYRLDKSRMTVQSTFILYGFLTLAINMMMFLTAWLLLHQTGIVYTETTFTVRFSIKYIALASLFALFMTGVVFVLQRTRFDFYLRENQKRKGARIQRILKYSISFIFIASASFLYFVTKWIFVTFGTISPDQLMFQLQVPLKGTDPHFIKDFIISCMVPSALIIIVCLLVLWPPLKKQVRLRIESFGKSIHFGVLSPLFVKRFLPLIAIISFLGVAIDSGKKLNIPQYITYLTSSSSLISDYYVEPQEVSLTFPENKRNLIFIFMESMESSSFALEDGGGMDVDLIPELKTLAEENIHFSNTEKLGGALPLPYASWTVAGMVAYNSGLPLIVSAIDGNDYGGYASFLPGATALGDILAEQGYKQSVMVGSDISYGGRDEFYSQHGDYEVFDLFTARDRELIPDDYNVFWGFEDQKLYSFAKQELDILASQDQPFNFTMLTVDTHFQDGYVCPLCRDEHAGQYQNVMSCASRQLDSFVEWIKQQDFYEDTTVVIVGDHLTMSTKYRDMLHPGYVRTPYNVILNSAVETDNVKNRQFSQFDFFPTTLAAMGVDIDGDRLALGTNLFSSLPTMLEKEGFTLVNQELHKASKFYHDHILVRRRNEND